MTSYSSDLRWGAVVTSGDETDAMRVAPKFSRIATEDFKLLCFFVQFAKSLFGEFKFAGVTFTDLLIIRRDEF
jgi:hypothetical protein